MHSAAPVGRRHGQSHSLEGRSLRSQRLSPSGLVVTGCDFSERRDTSHIARALSFDRKPSVRSFNLGGLPHPVRDSSFRRMHSQRSQRKTGLRRSNAFKMGPIQYIRLVFSRMWMRARLRRQSSIAFRQSNKSTKKRAYTVNPTSGAYQYRVKGKELFKRKPVVSFFGISGPYNAIQGSDALKVAEIGKNQSFNIKTDSHPSAIRKELPKRQSTRKPNSKASMLLAKAPDVGKPVPPDPENAARKDIYSNKTRYDDLPDLVPSDITGSRNPDKHLSLIEPEERVYEEEPVDIEDALEFVNAWGSYLQRALASRVLKDREVKLKELEDESRYINYEESDDSSAYSEPAPGVYESCTSECFQPTSDWLSTSDSEVSDPGAAVDSDSEPVVPQPTHARNIRPLPRDESNTTIKASRVRSYPSHSIPISAAPTEQAPLPPPHLPFALQAASRSQRSISSESSRRRVSGPRPMRSRHLSLHENVPPLHINTGRPMSAFTNISSDSPIRATPPISVRTSRVNIREPSIHHRAKKPSPDNEDFNFESGNEPGSLEGSEWVQKKRSSEARSSRQLQRKNAVVYNNLTPSHSAKGSAHSHTSSSASEMVQILPDTGDPLIQVWSDSSESIVE